MSLAGTSASAPVNTPRALTAPLIALLASLAALGALSTNIILPSFPAIAAALGVGSRDLGLTLSSFFVAFAFGQLAVGPLSDRYGRRPLVVAGLVVFVVGSVIAASATSLPMLVAARIIQALGVCAASVLSRAIARDLFDGAALGRALAFTMVAMAAAPGFSPLLGSAIEASFGWRAAFLLVGAGGVGVALFYLATIGGTHHQERRSAARLLSVLGDYGALVVDGRFVIPALAVSLIIGGLYAFFGAAPAILLERLSLSPANLGLFFAATVFVVFGAGMMATRLAGRFGEANVALAGALLALTGALLLLARSGDELSLAWFAVSLTVFLLGMGLANPLGTALALQPFGRHAGLASALLGFFQMGCAACATTVATLLPLPAATSLAAVLATSTGFSVFLLMVRSSGATKSSSMRRK